MKITITGICGFVGSSLARHLLERMDGLTILGIDNLVRPGPLLAVDDPRRSRSTQGHPDHLIKLESSHSSGDTLDSTERVLVAWN